MDVAIALCCASVNVGKRDDEGLVDFDGGVADERDVVAASANLPLSFTATFINALAVRARSARKIRSGHDMREPSLQFIH
jgi:hypothetical protein